MDEINYKLDTNDPVLISHAVSKLVNKIKVKIESDETSKDISQIAEYKFLLSKCKSNNPLLTAAICQSIILFVETGVLNFTSGMSTLISCLSTTINYPSITTAITHLLMLDLENCPAKGSSVLQYSDELQQHPFNLILNQEQHAWQSVLIQMKLLMKHSDCQMKEKCVEMLRPVFLYVLCDPSMHISTNCKLQIWELLIKSDGTLKLQFEVIQWLQTVKINSCIDTNCKIIQLAELTLMKGHIQYYNVLTSILTSLILRLFEYGFDPRPNFDVIISAVDHCDYYTINLILGLMIEIVTVCPVTHLQDVLKICDAIIMKSDCNSTLLHTLVAALLKWMAYTSILCSNALGMAHKLISKIILKIKKVTKPVEMTIPDIFMNLIHVDPNLQLYTEILKCISKLSANDSLSWLERLSSAPIDIRYRCKSVLCGLFLQSTNPQTSKQLCDILIQIVKEFNSFASHMLSLVLFKLTKSWDSNELTHLLFALPELVIVKENVPIVVNTLNTLLNSDAPLKYVAIELLLKAVERDSRCYRFLSAALMSTMTMDKSWHADVVCARAMAYICTARAEHGTELVPLLSQILNRCTDTNGCTASALALKSISGLCQSAVIGICSTWRILAPKMMKEERTIVLESLCEFLGNIPYFPSQSDEEYNKLIINVLTRLWIYATSNDIKVAQAAFKALMSYRLEHILLCTLPSEFKRDLVVPPVYAKMKTDDTQNAEDFIPYIPCICWIQMLEKLNKAVLSSAGDLLISYIKTEVESFRSGIYVWPKGEPNDYKYLPEKSVIKGVGEYLKRTKPDGENQKVITECLRIFAYKYNKPLPNIKWTFLERAMNISDKAKEYCILIASHHSIVSSSARAFIEKYLSVYKTHGDLSCIFESKEYLTLYSNLEYLCQGVQQQHLEPFFEKTMSHILEKIFFKNEESVKLFNNVMSSYTRALKNEEAREGNRTLITNMLEHLLDRIDLTSRSYDSYITAISQLSNTDIERITAPSLWWDVTPNKLRNAIIIRTELALKTDADKSLDWMNEPIDVAAYTPGVQVHLLESMRKVQTIMRCEKSSASWTLNFINRIQNVMSEMTEKDTEKLIFYIDILFISTICLSAVECLVLEKDAVINSREVRTQLFPQAIAILADRQYWKDIIPQVMDWMDYMRQSSIPESYKSSFHDCLVSLRHEPHYQSTWTKYLSAKGFTKM